MIESQSIASSAELIERARRQTGLADFGPEGWREGLDRLIAAMSEREFSEAATARIENRLTDVLETRLRIEDWIARHPEILDERIEGPVVILGLPRSATTAMQALLANDPQWRYLRSWESAAPVPPPDIATEANDPRVLAEMHGDSHSGTGLSQTLHIAEPGGPMDDTLQLRLNFHNQEFAWPAWSYTRWWRDCDMRGTYAYHERVLKLLQSRRPPNRWLVKAPWHNFHVETMAAHYPDARFIMCHRDPTELIPSVASLLCAVHRGFFGDEALGPREIGAFALEHLAISIRRVLDFRRRHGDHRFIDVRHGAFNADPFATVDAIYGWLGMELAPDARDAMRAWLERNRKGAHGEHTYSAEEFGLDPARIRAAFADYIAAFDL